MKNELTMKDYPFYFDYFFLGKIIILAYLNQHSLMELLIVDEKYRQIVALIKEVILSDIISDDYIINEVYDENYDNYIIKDNNDEDTENENDNNNNILMIMKVQKLY